jgi:hypothetical protein
MGAGSCTPTPFRPLDLSCRCPSHEILVKLAGLNWDEDEDRRERGRKTRSLCNVSNFEQMLHSE